MAVGWEEIRDQLDALAVRDKRLQAEGASDHHYQFDAPADAESVEAWLAEHGAWLERETRAFEAIETLMGLSRDLEDFRTGFLIREPELPFAMRLCSYWDVSPPEQYRFHESDPEPQTVRYRWMEEQFNRQRTRQRFHGGLGGLLKMFPRKKVTKG